VSLTSKANLYVATGLQILEVDDILVPNEAIQFLPPQLPVWNLYCFWIRGCAQLGVVKGCQRCGRHLLRESFPLWLLQSILNKAKFRCLQLSGKIRHEDEAGIKLHLLSREEKPSVGHFVADLHIEVEEFPDLSTLNDAG